MGAPPAGGQPSVGDHPAGSLVAMEICGLMSIVIPPAGDLCGTQSPPWQVKHLVSVPCDRIYYENQNSARAPSYIFENRRKDIAFMAELCGFRHAAIVEREIYRPILGGRQYDFVCRKASTFIPSKC
jgi:hypothetical protein